jgi:hypothetical protein
MAILAGSHTRGIGVSSFPFAINGILLVGEGRLARNAGMPTKFCWLGTIFHVLCLRNLNFTVYVKVQVLVEIGANNLEKRGSCNKYDPLVALEFLKCAFFLPRHSSPCKAG